MTIHGENRNPTLLLGARFFLGTSVLSELAGLVCDCSSYTDPSYQGFQGFKSTEKCVFLFLPQGPQKEEGCSFLTPGSWWCHQCLWCNPQTQGALLLMLSLSPWPVERNTGPLHNQLISWAAGVPWGGRLKSALSESSLEGAASGKFTQGRQWLNAEWKPLPFSFQHLRYQLKCVLEGLGTVLITAWTSTFSSGRKGSVFWIQWTGFLSQSYLLVVGILGLRGHWGPGWVSVTFWDVQWQLVLPYQILALSGVYLMFFGEVAQEAFKNGCSRERQWRCKAGSQNLLEKLTTRLASWSTHLAIKQEFTWEKSDFLC